MSLLLKSKRRNLSNSLNNFHLVLPTPINANRDFRQRGMDTEHTHYSRCHYCQSSHMNILFDVYKRISFIFFIILFIILFYLNLGYLMHILYSY